MECIFCRIIRGEIPAEIIYQDKNVLAFLDINPVAPGHTLVVPKKHTARFISAPDELIYQTIKTAKKIAPKVLKAVGATDFNLITNNGPAAGQSVEHLHFHIIPRGKDFSHPNWVTIKYEKNEMKEIANRIRNKK